MAKKKRCNDFYHIIMKQFADGETDRRLLSIGWMGGLAEKVYMGACRAAMVAPLRIDESWTCHAARFICETYGLHIFVKHRTSRTEIWFCRDTKTQYALDAYIDDNQFRATICGLDMALYDPKHPLEAPTK
jgi:hypothetical protein